jgi:hypothetical protein
MNSPQGDWFGENAVRIWPLRQLLATRWRGDHGRQGASMRKCFPRLIVASSAECRKFWLIAALYVRRKTRAAARIAGPVIILCALPGFASAQNATWSGTAASNLCNNGSNWTQGFAPGATGTATFGAAPQMLISTLGGVSVGTLQFNAPNYTFDAPDGLTINSNGVNASLANAQFNPRDQFQ